VNHRGKRSAVAQTFPLMTGFLSNMLHFSVKVTQFFMIFTLVAENDPKMKAVKFARKNLDAPILDSSVFTFSEPCIVIHIRGKDQQDAHFS